ncbi:putative Membrane protein [Candidatus Filomicrobium marinum]|uniref:Putative Membrane protein n=1 Tax=Candidatus Filomicrobium marinum TaxID=1608628 RepID=A0A0D6JH11_9HYPH|nr:glycosyltransferase family 39 protein [Candidatus Filomicrobium marinum]CFX45939.1 putative Membrane protein [Candidatus Filomicrobium marinum]CPR20710.1 putative Membrane protein [Candidatus Filomicrobium marinum]
MAQSQEAQANAANVGVQQDRRALQGLALVLFAVLTYSFLHVGFRLLASNVLGEDDVVDNILVQNLQAGYDAFPRQPPLYDWVLWGVQQVMGPHIESFLLIKYTALIATAGFLYLSALRVFKDRLFAILTVESLALIYQISWRFHEGFTHEVGAMVAVTATLWVFLRIAEDGGIGNFILLGVIAGLGFLTEPAYTVFLASLCLAASLQPGLRRRLFRAPLLLSLVIAVAIASPYLWWLLSDPRRLRWLTNADPYNWKYALDGFVDALRGPLAYLSPLIIILPLIFPRYLPTAWVDLGRAPTKSDPPDLEQWILHTALVAYALSIVGALAFAIHGLAVHVLMPLYITSTIWLFGVARRASGTPLHVKRFTRLAILIAVIAFVARMANMFILDPVCKTCRWGIPYSTLAQSMQDRGFDPKGTIISIDDELAGNLRSQFPEAMIVTRRYPTFTPEGADWSRGSRAYVWGANIPQKQAHTFMGRMLPEGRSVDEADTLTVPWHHLWREDGYRTTEWKLLIINDVP